MKILLRAAVFSKTLEPPLDGTDVFMGEGVIKERRKIFWESIVNYIAIRQMSLAKFKRNLFYIWEF